jgi:hypothetical protein
MSTHDLVPAVPVFFVRYLPLERNASPQPSRLIATPSNCFSDSWPSARNVRLRPCTSKTSSMVGFVAVHVSAGC